MSRAQADCSAERVNWVIESLDRVPAGAVFVENWSRPLAHQRCRELAMADPAALYLKGAAQRDGYTAAELRAEGLAGIYRLPKRKGKS
jgi:hypothetical protein